MEYIASFDLAHLGHLPSTHPYLGPTGLGKIMMAYKSVGISMILGTPNRACLAVAAGLAERFGARVIGMASTVLRAPLYYTDGPYGAGMLEREEEGLRQSLTNAEKAFRQAMEGRAEHIEWRASLRIAKDFLPVEARSVDIIVAAAQPEVESDPYASASPSDLVMDVGRPILIVPPQTTLLDARRILVAWKDTRESRRAVADALPLLQRADEVTVAEVCSAMDEPRARARVDDVAAWLLRHDVMASAITAEETDAAENLDTIASNTGAG